MKSFWIAILAIVGFTWANEDLLRDFLADVIHGDTVERRSLWNAATAGSVSDAAKNWIGNLGWSNSINSAVSKSFEDACLGSSGGINNIAGGINNINNNIGWNTWKGKREMWRRETGRRLANRDIVFVLDSSGSISEDQFEKAKRAVNILVEYFCPTHLGNEIRDEGSKQISVLQFDSTVTTEVDFSESSKGLGYLQDKIMSIKHRKGSTATGTALAYLKEKVLGKGVSRLNEPEVATDVIVITDGQCNVNCRILGEEANAIRRMGHGVNLYAMGVGNARACELEIISGSGSPMAYGLGDFSNFDRFALAVKELALEKSGKCV